MIGPLTSSLGQAHLQLFVTCVNNSIIFQRDDTLLYPAEIKNEMRDGIAFFKFDKKDLGETSLWLVCSPNCKCLLDTEECRDTKRSI